MFNRINRKGKALPLLFLFASIWQNTAASAQSNSEKPVTQFESTYAEETKKESYSKEAIEHYNRAIALHQAGFLDQASDEYKAAIKADKRMAEAWSNLAQVYIGQNQNDAAIEALQKALTLSEKQPGSHHSQEHFLLLKLALLYCSVGSYLEAEPLLKRALSINEKGLYNDYPETLDAYAKMLHKTDRSTEAEKLEERATKIRKARDQ